MGGMAAALGSMASSVGSGIVSGVSSIGSGIASGASSIGSGIAAGAKTIGSGMADAASGIGSGAIDFVSGAAKEGSDFIGKNIVNPVIDSAKEAGQNAFGGAKDFFAQGWDNAKKDFGERLDNIMVKDESGNIDGWKTAGNVAYQSGKALLSSNFAGNGGGAKVSMDQSQAQATPLPQTETAVAPNAEDELNKLRNRINAS